MITLFQFYKSGVHKINKGLNGKRYNLIFCAFINGKSDSNVKLVLTGLYFYRLICFSTPLFNSIYSITHCFTSSNKKSVNAN